MVCYGPRLSTIAAAGLIAYAIWHKVIIHVLHIAGLVMAITMAATAAAAAAAATVWAIRAVARHRASMGGCASCRFRCQLPLVPPRLIRTSHTGLRAAAPGTARRAAIPDTARRAAIPDTARRAAIPDTARRPTAPSAHQPANSPSEVVVYNGYVLTPDGVAGETSTTSSQ